MQKEKKIEQVEAKLFVGGLYLEFFLDALELVLGELSPLDGPLELILLHTELPAQLVQLLLVVRSHLGRLPQVLVVLFDGHLVVHALRLEDLHLFENVVCILGGCCQLGDSVGKVLLCLLGLLVLFKLSLFVIPLFFFSSGCS